MSAIAISYSDLKDSAQEADKVAKKVDAYADELSGILNKISKYDGKWTSYMVNAICEGGFSTFIFYEKIVSGNT